MDRDEEENTLGTMYGRSLMNWSNTTKIKPRQYFNLKQTVLGDASEYDDGFDELLKQTWNMWAVSTLFGFQYDSEVQLKLYAKKLREEAACSLLKEDVTYSAKFTLMDNLGPRPNPTDAPAVKIELIATSGAVERCIYKGFLISWRTELAEPITDKSVHLPLLLCRGTQNAMKTVHSIVSRMFDCTIVALPITDNDLKWLLPINLSPESNNSRKVKNELILLEYVVPRLPLTDTISVKFRVEDLKELWTALITPDVGEEDGLIIQAEHIEKIFKAINNQMLQVGSLRLEHCLLHKVSLPFFTISGNRIKAMNSQALNNSMLFLNEKAMDVLYTLHFESMQLDSSTA
ncbi:centromere protein L-like [Belonocnema kinseyi]|uniref:centromere protein L-like n=1 Tax=Belonocnema kinseyi TaxID=2817044 RepID=UPI00143D8ECE|nr:centromere protein L-like [Belonocnema kinseyi]